MIEYFLRCSVVFISAYRYGTVAVVRCNEDSQNVTEIKIERLRKAAVCSLDSSTAEKFEISVKEVAKGLLVSRMSISAHTVV